MEDDGSGSYVEPVTCPLSVIRGRYSSTTF